MWNGRQRMLAGAALRFLGRLLVERGLFLVAVLFVPRRSNQLADLFLRVDLPGRRLRHSDSRLMSVGEACHAVIMRARAVALSACVRERNGREDICGQDEEDRG